MSPDDPTARGLIMELAIDTYKRSAVVAYKTPNSRRFFVHKAKRLIRLARVVHNGRLFIPDIVASLREAAEELIELGNILLLTEKGYELLKGLTWIKSKEFAPEGLEWDVREKTRHHVRPEEKIRCSLCRTHLVYPAQIVWRRGLQIIDTSSDIGIYCLTREAVRNGWGKLQDLITQVRAVRETVAARHAPAEPADHGTRAGVATSTPTPTDGRAPARTYPRPTARRPTPVFVQLPLFYPEEP
jgi:hypothetical protein